MKSKYEEYEVIQSLNKKRDIVIWQDIVFQIKGNEALNDIGIGSLGKIDFLKSKGYSHFTRKSLRDIQNSIRSFESNFK